MAEPAIAVQIDDALRQSSIRKFSSLSPCEVQPKLRLNRSQTFLGLSFFTLCQQYLHVFTSFALEWSPDDFIFRELAFAIISLASGQIRFHSFPKRDCNPRYCLGWNCSNGPNGHPDGKGRVIIPDGTGGSNVLPKFGHGCHRPDEAPGAAPIETMYWFEGVLISLATSIHESGIREDIITRTVEFGVEQGKENFQAVIMSLFHLILVEVNVRDRRTTIKLTKTMRLSPIRRTDCLSTDPRNRPEAKPGDKFQGSKSLATLASGVAYQSPESFRQCFPGFVSLMNFFDTAMNRRAASRSPSRLPPEICYRILECTDDTTYLACAKVSENFRAYCLQNFRAGRWKIISEPWSGHTLRVWRRRYEVMAFTFVDRQTSEVIQLKVFPHDPVGYAGRYEHNWSPIVGSGREVILSDVSLNFEFLTSYSV